MAGHVHNKSFPTTSIESLGQGRLLQISQTQQVNNTAKLHQEHPKQMSQTQQVIQHGKKSE